MKSSAQQREQKPTGDHDGGNQNPRPVPEDTAGGVIEVRVEDDSTNIVLRASAPQWRGIIEALPATSIIGGNPSP